MRVVSYNILAGGFADYDCSDGWPVRMELIVKAVKSLNADLVTLIDTYRWQERFPDEVLGNMFGYPRIHRTEMELRPGLISGIVIMAKGQIDEFKTMTIHDRKAIRTKMKLGGKEISLYSVYLDDKSEDTRLKESESLLRQCRKDSMVIMGDFNMVDKNDLAWWEKALIDLASATPLFGQLRPVWQDMKRGEVIKLFKSRGLMDTDPKRRFTMPTPLFEYPIPRPILRLDYAFHTPDLEISNFRVPRGKIFGQASDHYPMVFEVKSDLVD